MPSLEEIFVEILTKHPQGMPDPKLKEHFGAQYNKLVPIINQFLSQNRIQLFKDGKSLVYKLIKEDAAAKFQGLGPEQMMVYQVIERAGNVGIWTRDIKNQTNIQQQTLTKTLKLLESRQLVKSVKSITSKSKKLYILFDVIPAKEITGGPWYSEQEFDSEFIEELSRFVYQLIQRQGMASLTEICERVRVSGISRVDLSREEVLTLVNTLVYDYAIEQVSEATASNLAVASGRVEYHGDRVYKVMPEVSDMNRLTDTPCGLCPVVNQCEVGGIISPTTCIYMDKWLNLEDLDF